MTKYASIAFGVFAVAAVACGPGAKSDDTTPKTPDKPADPNTVYGPLEVGAGFEGWNKVTKFPHPSPTHGKRFAEIYVNDVGFAAYTSEADFPVGTVIVKQTWENDGGKPSTVKGPVFVMEKKPAGYDADREDWYFAIHWAEPTEKFAKQLGGPFYWRSPSKKVDYCWNCHENYDREVGLPPKDARTWQEKPDEDQAE
jgi:hypothetical protein